jgi:hypothetical protein
MVFGGFPIAFGRFANFGVTLGIGPFPKPDTQNHLKST